MSLMSLSSKPPPCASSSCRGNSYGSEPLRIMSTIGFAMIRRYLCVVVMVVGGREGNVSECFDLLECLLRCALLALRYDCLLCCALLAGAV